MRYGLYEHAGKVPYNEWKNNGIAVPIFDKDGTLTHANRLEFVDEVIDELKGSDLPDVFPHIALVSNNHDHEHVQEFADLLKAKLGVHVFAISRAQGYKSKPQSDMGIVVAKEFNVHPNELGVIGDRLLTDIRFARKLGAGAAALCTKAGEGDASWVPMLRVIESGLIAVDRFAGRAITA